MGTVITLIVIVAAVIAVLAFRGNKKRMESSWSGTVTDKKVRKSDDGPDAFYVTFTTDTGESKRLSVKQGLYDEFNVGDAVIKQAGQRNPVKR